MARKKLDTENKLFDSENAVLAMPDGYYSGDRVNPNLRKFVTEHATPYDPEADDYNVRAFTTPITTTKATAIYNMHSYHQGKKPHDAIRQYIRHYTSVGNIVLDTFAGSGSTALAALMERRIAIAIDRSPAATFITKNYCTPINISDHYCPVKSRRESVGWRFRRNPRPSRWPEGRIKWAFSRRA